MARVAAQQAKASAGSLLGQIQVPAQAIQLSLGPHSLQFLRSQEQAPGDALVALRMVQLVRDRDALQRRQLSNGAHRESLVHKAIMDIEITRAEQRDAKPCNN